MLTARETALKALVKIEKDNLYANLVTPGFLKQVDSRERPFARSIVYGTISHLNTIDWILSLYLSKPLKNLTPFIRNILRSAVYQVTYLQNVPYQVSVDESVKLSYRYGHKGVAGLVNAVLRRVVNGRADLPWPDPENEKELYLSLYHSIPLWIVRRWIIRMGQESAAALCLAYSKVPPLNIRTNLLKSTREDLQKLLQNEGIETSLLANVHEGLSIKSKGEKSFLELNSYKEGLFTLQNESSMIVGRAMAPLPGKTILDLCSAPGGKTTHLAELMEDEGLVLAKDVHAGRLELVSKQALRLGLKVIRTGLWDAQEAGAVKEPVDYVLCDAPCSGLGVLNRKPDLKWHRKEEEIKELALLQSKILAAASLAVKSGGKLLYSVCTNEEEETVNVAEHFIKNNPDFSIIPVEEDFGHFSQGLTENKYLEFYPHLHGKDGFFMALFQKK